jgi:putative ABC transport system ATP-binding protein
MALIEIKDMYKIYEMGSEKVNALDGVSLKINEKEFVAIVGPSGSGKSTLMNMIGCLDTPTSGTYLLDGEDISGLSDSSLAKIRNRKIGFIFQQFNLFQKMTAFENVERPIKYAKVKKEQRKEMTAKALRTMGLGDRMKHRPSELSGGQQQRVAIARALVGNPPVLLADEPTGNLDSKSSAEIMNMIKELHKNGNTIVLITHDMRLAEQADRILQMSDGRIVRDTGRKEAAK